MRLSRYFHELRGEYEAELDDLRTDSEDRPVLDRRLAEKRRALSSILPLMAYAPVMVVPVFHRAFGFEKAHRPTLFELLDCEPGEFPAWETLSNELFVADWARPMIAKVLAHAGGEDFLATAVALEFEMTLARGYDDGDGEPTAEDGRGRGSDADEDTDANEVDDETQSEDYLEQQGFDRRTPQ
jgi:hypothetical protein